MQDWIDGEDQGENGLREEAIPFFDVEWVVNAREDGNELSFESLDGPFGNIASVDVGSESITAYGRFEFTRGFIVKVHAN